MQKSKYLRGKMTFPKLDATLRSDKDFELQVQQEHHKGNTPLEKLGIGLVSNVPLDYMHLVCLGVMKTLLMFVIGKKGKNCRLNDNSIKSVSETMRIFRRYVPQEFCRLPRSLEDIEHWKATEFRQFLLYTGPVALKEKLSKVQFKHFLCLHVAIRILCSVKCISLNRYAKSLLKYFVKNFKKIYGNEYITFNVHNLLHLCDDVLLYGTLDNFSAFKFENYMSNIKRNIKKSRYPLQQIHNRIIEDRKLIHIEKTSNFLSFQEDNILVCNEDEKTYYRKLTYKNLTISLCQRNNCVLLKNLTYMLISNIYKNNNNDIKIVGRIFQNVLDFVKKPSFSIAIKIVDIHETSEISTFDFKDIKAKCVLLPTNNNKFAIISILHKND